MVYAVIVLAILCISLILYLIRIWLQLRSINHQLASRAKEQSKQLVTVSVEQKEITTLVSNINRCLRAEEKSSYQARRSEKEFKQLIANLSHDLRTPLTAIRGYLQLISSDQFTANEQKNLEVALRYTTELGQLIEHFFEYTYLVDAPSEMKRKNINLTNVVIQSLADSVNLFEEQELQVKMMGDKPVMAYVDKEMTIRILQNLIRNCLAHSGGDVKVWVDKTDQARIHFMNPIRPGYRVDPAHIFDRFYTGDASRHRTTGLGLSIVKLLTERMGGKALALVKHEQLEIIIELPIEQEKG